ncbi:MAG: putative DNA binding domain-containing protein [Solobacterium sp.]|jgi:ATP-dependent DNA helicase RecG|nr:putative DNA binding domain-containing protein [Solobacterium sp.]MCH4265796.1 putative DNA binding domain-containing protein [Solobacterium sp.]
MEEETLKKLIGDIQRQKNERQNVELKQAHVEFPGRIFDTLSSFSNQDDGGIMIFGIKDKPTYEVVGVYDAESVQKKIMEACEQMEPKVRALLTVCEINPEDHLTVADDGCQKVVVAAEIPGAELLRRPVFYAGRGRLKGSYVRVADADEPMTEYEVYSYEVFRKRIRDELRTVDPVKVHLFDQQRLSNYLEAVKEKRSNLAEHVSDQEILELMGITAGGKSTLAGVMTFSIYPQTWFPQLCITALSFTGNSISEAESDEERFIDNVRITGSIPEMVEEAVNFVKKNSRRATVIDENGKRKDRFEYPVRAVREAVLNSLVHRDYSVYTENIPVSIEIYRNRMEIRNCGAPLNETAVLSLGWIRPETRNPALANMLEILEVTENRYSGIPTIINECRKAEMPDPEFTISHGEFKVTFRSRYALEDTKAAETGTDIEQSVLEFCSVPRDRAELVRFTGKSRYTTMSKIVIPLVESGKLKRTIPDKPQSSMQKYIKA